MRLPLPSHLLLLKRNKAKQKFLNLLCFLSCSSRGWEEARCRLSRTSGLAGAGRNAAGCVMYAFASAVSCPPLHLPRILPQLLSFHYHRANAPLPSATTASCGLPLLPASPSSGLPLLPQSECSLGIPIQIMENQQGGLCFLHRIPTPYLHPLFPKGCWLSVILKLPLSIRGAGRREEWGLPALGPGWNLFPLFSLRGGGLLGARWRPPPLPLPSAAVLPLLSAGGEGTPPQGGDGGRWLEEQAAIPTPLSSFFFNNQPPPHLDSPQFPW